MQPKAILLFSGGKDSLAALLFLRAHWSDITVLWANPGGAHPRLVDYMAQIRARVPHFVEVNGRSREWIARFGWPADVVPVRWTDLEHGADAPRVRFVPYTQCCSANMWQPLRDYIDASGVPLIITGQKGSDALRQRARDREFTDIAGRTYWNPLQTWDDERVLAFLRERGEPLPPGYDDGQSSSSDCWYCTAYLDHNTARLQRMRREEPQRWDLIGPVLAELDAGLCQAHAGVQTALME